MNFKDYLKVSTAYIQVKNVYKIEKDYNIKIKDFKKSSADDEYYNLIIDKIEKGEITQHTDLETLFYSYIKLGKSLYEINKDNINKIKVYEQNIFNINVEANLIVNKINDKSLTVLTEWLNNNFILTIDKDLDKGYFTETTKLIDLSIFMYLVTQAFKTEFGIKSDSNKVSFNMFIDYKNSNPNYLSIIEKVIDFFEESLLRKYIKEKTELIYDEETSYLKPYKVFDNIYSLMWYIFKLYLSFLTTQGVDTPLYTLCKVCGSNTDNFKNKLCPSCKEKYATIRRALNRENKKNLDKIKILITGQTFPSNLQERIDMILNKKIKHEDNNLIKHLLRDIEEYLNLV